MNIVHIYLEHCSNSFYLELNEHCLIRLEPKMIASDLFDDAMFANFFISAEGLSVFWYAVEIVLAVLGMGAA